LAIAEAELLLDGSLYPPLRPVCDGPGADEHVALAVDDEAERAVRVLTKWRRSFFLRQCSPRARQRRQAERQKVITS